MTQFWFGFITAIALIAVTIIAGALLSYRKSERKRQQATDAIIAKIASGHLSVNEGRELGELSLLQTHAHATG